MLDGTLNIFQEMSDKGEQIRLLNTYRGLPITNPATILGVKGSFVSVKVHPLQAACIAMEGRTHLQTSRLPGILRAKVLTVNVVEQRAVLSEFTSERESIGKRAAVRVQPDEVLRADIYGGRRCIEGTLADISTIGVGVFAFSAYIYGDLALEQNKEVNIELGLPTTEAVICFPGRIMNLLALEDVNMHRIGVRIYPTQEVLPLLEEYIRARQNETLLELKQIYQSMCQEKRAQG